VHLDQRLTERVSPQYAGVHRTASKRSRKPISISPVRGGSPGWQGQEPVQTGYLPVRGGSPAGCTSSETEARYLPRTRGFTGSHHVPTPVCRVSPPYAGVHRTFGSTCRTVGCISPYAGVHRRRRRCMGNTKGISPVRGGSPVGMRGIDAFQTYLPRTRGFTADRRGRYCRGMVSPPYAGVHRI